MGKPALTVVRSTSPLAERIARLRREERALANEHVDQLTAALAEVERLAGEIAAGGGAYHVGVREIARRLTAEAGAHGQTIEAIRSRG